MSRHEEFLFTGTPYWAGITFGFSDGFSDAEKSYFTRQNLAQGKEAVSQMSAKGVRQAIFFDVRARMLPCWNGVSIRSSLSVGHESIVERTFPQPRGPGQVANLGGSAILARDLARQSAPGRAHSRRRRADLTPGGQSKDHPHLERVYW